MKDTIRNVIDIIEYLEVRNEKQAALMFLDAAKAFDKVSWDFMFKVLEHSGTLGYRRFRLQTPLTQK